MSITETALKIINSAFDAIKGITNIQDKLINYRLSDEAKEIARRKENQEFNKASEEKNTKICDSIRKKKQLEIERLEEEVKK